MLKGRKQSDKMKQSIRNIFWLYTGLFSLVIFYLVYFMIFSSRGIVNNPHNPRLGVLDSEIKRGAIYDDRGYMLVNSEISGSGYTRNYFYDNDLCHLLGYVGRGKSGIEARYNFELQKLHNEVWQRLSQLITGEELRGNSLVLTINLEIQKEAYKQLEGNKGAIVVLEPDTGKILAMASYPDFNPNNIASNWSSLDADERGPFLNRATQGLYPPGSIFKIITAAAIIENNENYNDILYTCEGEQEFNGNVIHCYDGKKHGEIDLDEAFAYSCNTFFSEEGYELGAQNLINSAEMRYFNSPLSYDLEYNKSSFQLSVNSSDSELVETSIGQGRTLVSPLHMAMLASAIANNGIMMKPYVVDHVTSYNERIISKNLPKMVNTVFTPEEAEILKNMMRQVVQYGTGAGADIDGAFVAGKTGTAENPNGTSHSWFVSFAEADGKKVAAAVVLENPEAGRSSVPIAKNVLKAALSNRQE